MSCMSFQEKEEKKKGELVFPAQLLHELVCLSGQHGGSVALFQSKLIPLRCRSSRGRGEVSNLPVSQSLACSQGVKISYPDIKRRRENIHLRKVGKGVLLVGVVVTLSVCLSVSPVSCLSVCSCWSKSLKTSSLIFITGALKLMLQLQQSLHSSLLSQQHHHPLIDFFFFPFYSCLHALVRKTPLVPSGAGESEESK